MDDVWNVMFGHSKSSRSWYLLKLTMKEPVCLYTQHSLQTVKGFMLFLLISTVLLKDRDVMRTNRGAKQQVNCLSADANRKKRLRHNGPRPLLQKCPVVLHSWAIKYIVLRQVWQMYGLYFSGTFLFNRHSWKSHLGLIFCSYIPVLIYIYIYIYVPINENYEYFCGNHYTLFQDSLINE